MNTILRSDIFEIVKQKGLTQDQKNILNESDNFIKSLPASYSFSESGLTITDGNFQIFKTEDGKEKQLFSADKDGNLTISGTIYTKAGEIGGFNITGNGIENTARGDFSLRIEPDSTSTLEVSRIILGSGAKIKDYLELGNFKIQNPEKTKEGKVLISTKEGVETFSLTDEGFMRIGSIKADGQESTLRGDNWEITPNLASFSNASISGVLNTTVFNKETISAIGNSMIFVHSFNVNPIENYSYNNEQNEIYLDLSGLTEKVPVGYYVYLTLEAKEENSYGVKYLLGRCEKEIEGKPNIYLFTVFNSNLEAKDYFRFQDENTLIHVLGQKNDTIFSISCGNNTTNSQGFLQRNALSLVKIDEDSLPKLNFDKKLILGALDGVLYNDKTLSGYGLYSDNVYLNGQFVGGCEIKGQKYYAGINGNSGVKSKKFSNESEQIVSPILFYAGAQKIDFSEDDNIPFYVTTDGNLYANKGYFEGSIITNAEIEAASLTTAAIYPRNNEPSLRIYNMTDNGVNSGGISFCSLSANAQGNTRATNSSDEVMRISTSGFYLGARNFISFSKEGDDNNKDFIIHLDVDDFSAKASLRSGRVRLAEDGIQLLDKDSGANEEVVVSSLVLKEAGGFKIGEGISYENELVQIEKKALFIDDLNFGKRVKFQQAKMVQNGENVQVGYDLYIGVE